MSNNTTEAMTERGKCIKKDTQYSEEIKERFQKIACG